jgi:DNA-binding LytR/AlgR family response regulator
MKTACIIVDDEPLARSAIRALLARFDDIEIVADCEDTFEAMKILQQKKIDLMFLDIQMPEVSGLDFLRSLRQAPAVILTTAYRQYALEGFELDVVDYLLKPVSAERMMKALDKFYHLQRFSGTQAPIREPSPEGTLTIRAERKNILLHHDDILWIMSMKDYVQIFTTDKKHITQLPIGVLEKKLPEDTFLRIHRSYIVNLSKVTAFTSLDVEIGNRELPIGRSYQNLVINTLKARIS